MDASAHQSRLVDALIADGRITSAAVEAAFRATPRHLFVPEVTIEAAYRDEAIPIKFLDGRPVSSASQPSIVAVMLEQLGVAEGHHVLEIGAGSGYNAALLARLVGPSGRVVTVDIDADIVAMARSRLDAAGVEGVEVVCADGAGGHHADAPYDRIVLTVAASDIPPAWWEQLRPDGRLLLPLSLRGVQRCVAFARRDAWLESTSVRGCGFIHLRGPASGHETSLTVGSVTATFDTEVDISRLPAILARQPRTRELGVTVDARQAFDGLALWLAIHDPGYCSIDASWERHEQPPVPMAAVFPSGDALVGWSPASFTGSSLVIVGCGPGDCTARVYGDDTGHAEQIAAEVRGWDAAGRPESDSLRISAYPVSDRAPDTDGLISIPRKWTTLLLDWIDHS